MNRATIAGRVTRSELRQVGSGSLLKFSVAADRQTKKDGQWQKVTEWFECCLWGPRGEKLANHITKGTNVTVFGERETREHDGKKYYDYRVHELTIHWPPRDDVQRPRHDTQPSSGMAPQQFSPDTFGPDDDPDSIPF